jgi:hypothetical protein
MNRVKPMSMKRILVCQLSIFALATGSGCASDSTESVVRSASETSRPISGFGVGLELPPGWYGRVVKPGERDSIVVSASNFAQPHESYLGPKTAKAMDEDSIHIELAGFDPHSDELAGRASWKATELPISIDRSHLGGPFEGMPAPAVAARWLVIDGRAVMVFVGFGTSNPSDAMFDEANRVLATLSIDEEDNPSADCQVLNEGVPFFPQFGEDEQPRGAAGERFQILAAGMYAPAQRAELLWEDSTGASRQPPIAEIAAGCYFSLEFTVPEVEPGRYRIVIRSYDPDSDYAITSAHSFRVTTSDDSPRRTAWIVHYDPAYGLTLSHPPTWFRARQSLNPRLADPIELVTLATFPPGAPVTGCAQLPIGALEKLGLRDAVVSLQERSAEPVGFPARLGPFRLDDGLPSEATECLAEPPAFVDRLIPFADGARPLYAYVAIGNEAEPATLDQALGILNTLRVAARD